MKINFKEWFYDVTIKVGSCVVDYGGRENSKITLKVVSEIVSPEKIKLTPVSDDDLDEVVFTKMYDEYGNKYFIGELDMTEERLKKYTTGDYYTLREDNNFKSDRISKLRFIKEGMDYNTLEWNCATYLLKKELNSEKFWNSLQKFEI